MKFSVIIPTHNRGWLIKETIESVLNQRFKDFEVIVVDDGSTDDTFKILAEYTGRIKILSQSNSGGEQARNRGAEISNGEYLAFLDDDDIFFPFTLEIYNKVINTKNSPALLAGQPFYFNDKIDPVKIPYENKIKFYSYKDYFSKDVTIFTSCSMLVVRKDIFKKINGFGNSKSKMVHAHDDFRFLLKVGSFGPAEIITEPKLFGYRQHSTNSVKNINKVLSAISKLISDERIGIFKVEPGDRKLDRYAILGSTSFFWCKKALRKGKIFQPVKLFFIASPMIFVSIIKKLKRKLIEGAKAESI